MTGILAWHFIANDRTLAHTSPPYTVKVGDTLAMTDEPTLCERGYHASRRIIDALKYAPGNTICRVLVGGTIVEERDKLAGQTRTVIAMIDGSRLLREWACDMAERALLRERARGREPDPRSWAAIAVARRFARGEATKRELTAAWDSAEAVAWPAAWTAAWAAARTAASAVAWPVAWPAGGAAAGYAAGYAAWAAGGVAEIADQNTELTRRVLAAMGIDAETRVPLAAA